MGSVSGQFEEEEDEPVISSRFANGVSKGGKADSRSGASSYAERGDKMTAGHAATIGHAASSVLSRSQRSDQGGGGNGGAGGREFLSYFFGGASAMPGSAGISGPGSSVRGAFGESTPREHKPNPMHGRTGLEGSSAAFDMKSLDKHIEAVSKCGCGFVLVLDADT